MADVKLSSVNAYVMTSRNAQGFDAEQRLVTDPPQFVMVGQVSVRTACRQRMLQIPGCEN